MKSPCAICNIKTSNDFHPIADGNLVYRASNGVQRVLCRECEILWKDFKVLIPETDEERQLARESREKLVTKKIEGLQGKNDGREE